MNNDASTPVSLIGVPMDLGAENLGVGMGADSFRYQHIVKKLESAGLSVTDKGNVTVADRKDVSVGNPRLRHLDEIIRVSEETAGLVETAIRNGEKAVVLGGDHSITLGTVAGASVACDGNIGVIYFDAHGDMNTDETTPTGNIHGMQLASLMGFGAPELAKTYGDQVKLQKEHLLHIGGCDFDQSELDLMARENIKAFTMLDLLSRNMAPLFPMIDELASKVDNIWISLDLDSIDAVYAPGAGMPNQKGLTYREIATIADYIGKKCSVVGVDVVEYNPLQDKESKTAELATELIATFLGHNYSWYTGYLEANKL
ncbi:MAG: Arginase [Candidatus Saccharibacteria bacterium]|nr:Arginase [Candidatus Saccharibacteria bacterium]